MACVIPTAGAACRARLMVAGLSSSSRVSATIGAGIVALKNSVCRLAGRCLSTRLMSGRNPMSSMRSASSRTRNSRPASLAYGARKWSSSRPGVAMITSTPRRNACSCGPMPTPPKTAAALTGVCTAKLSRSSRIWAASSRVGVRTRARVVPRGLSSSLWRIGSRKAAVLPLPVAAHARTSRPARAGPMASDWMGVGRVNPRSFKARVRLGCSPRCEKGTPQFTGVGSRVSLVPFLTLFASPSFPVPCPPLPVTLLPMPAPPRPPWTHWFATLTTPRTVAAAGALMAATGLVLLFMGRTPICRCGYVSLWHGQVNSAGNSQHLTDWYTFSHVIHGFAFYGVLWLLGRCLPLTLSGQRGLPVGARLAVAVMLEGSWEVLENTDMVINRYREATIALDYYGDSVLNSLSDVGAMVVGFALAARLPVWVIVAAAITMEIVVGYLIRDNLTLNIVMLLYPLEAVRAWQMAGQ